MMLRVMKLARCRMIFEYANDAGYPDELGRNIGKIGACLLSCIIHELSQPVISTTKFAKYTKRLFANAVMSVLYPCGNQ